MSTYNELVVALIRTIKETKRQLDKLEQTYALLTADADEFTAPVAVESELESEPKPQRRVVTSSNTAPNKRPGKSPAALLRRKWAKEKPKPWKAAAHAKPETLKIYEFLADGREATSREVLAYVRQSYPKTAQEQVNSALAHMRLTGRLMHAGGKWRRKYSRNKSTSAPTPQVGIVAENIAGSDSVKSEAVLRLEKLVETGKAHKVQRGGQTIYMPGPAPRQ